MYVVSENGALGGASAVKKTFLLRFRREGLRPHGYHDGIDGVARVKEKGGGGGKGGDRLATLGRKKKGLPIIGKPLNYAYLQLLIYIPAIFRPRLSCGAGQLSEVNKA